MKIQTTISTNFGFHQMGTADNLNTFKVNMKNFNENITIKFHVTIGNTIKYERRSYVDVYGIVKKKAPG